MEPRTQRPRIADVAREAGVSKTAVSFAFNSPDRLAPETAVRIREIALQLGYTPHPVARMLTQRQTMTIGVLTPQALSVIFSNPFFGAFSEGVALVAEEYGYGLHFISPLHGSLIRAMTRATVDGVVAIGLADGHPEVGADPPGRPADRPGRLARAARARLGRDRRRGWRAGRCGVHRQPRPPGRARAGRRAAGTRWTRSRRRHQPPPARLPGGVRAVGVEIPDDRVVVGPASIDGGIAATTGAWADGLRPTAILAMSDAMAIGAMRALRDLRLDIPGDVSVVGFDDIDLAPHVDPPLTTVHQPIRRKGEEAVRALLTVIERRGQSKPEHRRLETRLIIRGSTGPVPMDRREVAGEAG